MLEITKEWAFHIIAVLLLGVLAWQALTPQDTHPKLYAKIVLFGAVLGLLVYIGTSLRDAQAAKELKSDLGAVKEKLGKAEQEHKNLGSKQDDAKHQVSEVDARLKRFIELAQSRNPGLGVDAALGSGVRS